MKPYLLHLELDGGLEIVGLSRQVIVVGHQGGELTRLGSQEHKLLTELLTSCFSYFYYRISPIIDNQCVHMNYALKKLHHTCQPKKEVSRDN
jgi:hypothetical protein